MSPTPEQFAALFDPRGVVIAGASTHPGKFGFVSLHNLLANGYEGRVFATNLEGSPVLGHRHPPLARRAARGRRGPDLRVHPQGRQPRPAAHRCGQGCPGRVPDLRRVRRIGRAGQGRRSRAGRALRRARHPARGAERPGRGVHPGVAVRADRRPVPTGRPDRCGQPVRQLRVQLHELVLRHRRRHLAGGVRRQRRGDRRRRLPGPLRGRSRRPAWASPTSRASPTAEASSTRSAGSPDECRWCWSRAARPPAARRPPRATPARCPPTTGPSRAPAVRPA